MEHTPILHIVDSSSRSRAEQARFGFAAGYHCEIYSSLSELLSVAPPKGIVLARDREEFGGAAKIAEELANRGIWLPVIATAVDPRPARIVAAIRCGVLDYLRLPLREDRLGAAVARIRDEAQADMQARRKIAEARGRIASLSPREREVLDWLAEGCSNKMIAQELHISARTVEIHRANMMSKLGARHAAEAVRLCIEAGARYEAFAPGGLTTENPASPAKAAVSQFEVQMVVVRRVVIGSQYRPEPLAGAAMDDAEEFPFLRTRVPAILHRNATPVGKEEGTDIDRLRA